MAANDISSSSVTNTTAVALSTSSGGSVLIWLLRCIEAGQMEVPTAEVAMTLVAFLAPFLHAISRVLLHKIAPPDDDEHRAPPPPPPPAPAAPVGAPA